MTSLQPPNMQQLHPNHMPILPHPHLPRPLPHNMPSSMPMHAQMGTMNQMGQPMQQSIHFRGMNPMHSGSMSGNQMYSPGGAFNRPQGAQMSSMPGLGGPYQGTMNQMGQPMQQSIHFRGMNPMHSGSMSGNQMYSPGGAFNRPQGAQMSSMPGLGGPYQPGNPSGPGMGTVPPNFGMPSGIAPSLPPGPPPHGQTPL